MYRLRVIAIVVLTCQVASLTALDSLVLCAGMDGHVALEASPGVDSCESTSPETVVPFRPSTPAITHGAGGSHCGPCRDVSFGMGLAEQVGARGRMTEPDILPTGASSDPNPSGTQLYVHYTASACLPQQGNPCKPASLLRSTILLT